MDLLKNSYEKGYFAFSDDIFKALEDILRFNLDSIYTNPKINTELSKIENMYLLLFNRYLKDLRAAIGDSAIRESLADMDEEYLRNTNDKRIAADFLAGMTDDFFTNQYQSLFVPRSYGYSL